MVESFDARHAVPLQPVQPGGRRVERLFVSGQQHHIANELAPHRFKAALFHRDAQARIVRIGERLPLAGACRGEHALAEKVLRNRQNHPEHYAGCNVAMFLGSFPLAEHPDDTSGPQVDEEMVEAVGRYVDTVWALSQGNELLVEQRVDFSHIVGVDESFGTADGVIIAGNELQIHDLKYGKGVRVDAEHNEQLQLYALGALEQFSMPLIEDAGYSIVLTVHDEVITEAPDTDDFNDKALSALLSTNPEWAPDIPLNAGGFEAYHYRKD